MMLDPTRGVVVGGGGCLRPKKQTERQRLRGVLENNSGFCRAPVFKSAPAVTQAARLYRLLQRHTTHFRAGNVAKVLTLPHFACRSCFKQECALCEQLTSLGVRHCRRRATKVDEQHACHVTPAKA